MEQKVIEQVMEYERTTKGSHLYSAPSPDTARIRNMYLRKQELGSGNPPKTITVKVECSTEAVAELKY